MSYVESQQKNWEKNVASIVMSVSYLAYTSTLKVEMFLQKVSLVFQKMEPFITADWRMPNAT
jgi:hypothetical protein